MIVVNVRRINDRVMSLAIIFEEIMRVVCAYVPQSGKFNIFNERAMSSPEK